MTISSSDSATIAESSASSLSPMTNSNLPPNAFSSNLVGGKIISRKQMRKIYKSYKNKYSSRGRSIKKRVKSMSMSSGSNFITRMFKKIGSKKNKNHKKHRHGKQSRYNKRGGSVYNPEIALASASLSTFGQPTSCLI
jgi:hypothetical protein